MAPVLSVDEPFIGQKGHQMRKDPCYLSYAEALQCLDKYDYQQQLCLQEFLAFKACRNQQKQAADVSRLQTFESDPLLGWAFKLYNKRVAGQEAPKEGSSSTTSSSSSSSQIEYQGWRPPPEDVGHALSQASNSSGSSSDRSSRSNTSSSGASSASHNSSSSISSMSNSNSNSSSSDMHKYRPLESNRLWGWASRWYNRRHAATDDNTEQQQQQEGR